jgi:hypothetical protein
MAITIYSELETAVTNWLARSDVQPRASEFIALCTAKLNRTLQTRWQESAVTSISTDASGRYALPVDFAQINWVRHTLGQGAYIDPVANQEGMDMGLAGYPRGYTINGNELQTWPPQVNGTGILKIQYRKKIPQINSGTDTNWVLTDHPDVYLYGALLESAAYIRDDERIGLWTQGLATAIKQIQDLDEISRWPASNMQMRPRAAALQIRR